MTMLSTRLRVLLLSPLLALVTACSALPKPQAAPELYQLSTHLQTSAQAVPTGGAPRLPYQVVVQPPLAPLSIDNNRIALMTDEHEIKYLRGARWSDNTPQIVQQALIESLETTSRFAAVARATGGVRSDYALMAELKDFEADLYSGAGASAKISMMLQLVRQPGGVVVAARSFSAEAPAEGRSAKPLVRAFDTALQSIMAEVGPWAAESLSGANANAREAERLAHPQRKASSEPVEPAPTP